MLQLAVWVVILIGPEACWWEETWPSLEGVQRQLAWAAKPGGRGHLAPLSHDRTLSQPSASQPENLVFVFYYKKASSNSRHSPVSTLLMCSGWSVSWDLQASGVFMAKCQVERPSWNPAAWIFRSLIIPETVSEISASHPEQVPAYLHGSGPVLCISDCIPWLILLRPFLSCFNTPPLLTPTHISLPLSLSFPLSLFLSGSLPPFVQPFWVSLSLWSVRKLLKWEMSLRKLVVLIKLWHEEWQEAMKGKQ